MKKLHHIVLIVLAVFIAACTTNPLEDIEGNRWQKERNILSILIEGQMGTAVIERDFDNTHIKVYAKLDDIADITKVEIKEIELSYGASSPNAAGSTIDLSSGSNTITVVSGAGEPIEWDITLEPFVSDLEGTWYVGELGVYCNMFTWESWGWHKYELLTNYLPAAQPELDNVITFEVEGADAKGNPYGVFEHSAGEDAAYGEFTDEAKGWDFTERFRKMPKGTGTWLRDFERNKVVITDSNGKVIEMDLELNSETGEVTLEAGLPYLADLFNWNDTDWNYEELAHMSNPMWYKLTKNPVLQTGNNISSFEVVGQVGDAAIDGGNKQVTVTIEDNGADISAIEITKLGVSYKATTNKEAGQTLDFSVDNTAQILVTSEAGEEATWTIKLQIDLDVSDVSIAGTWTIGEIGIYCDLFTWESWGWDKSEKVTNYLPNANTELDNTITFTVEGKNEQNQPYGSYENNAGADGEYGNFTSDDTSWPETDFNNRLRKVPTGSGTWVLDGETVTITSSDETEFVLTLEVKTQTEIALTTELEYFADKFDWDLQNYSYEEVAHMSKKLWYNLNKQQEVQTTCIRNGAGGFLLLKKFNYENRAYYNRNVVSFTFDNCM